MDAGGLTREALVEPIEGWRAWNLSEEADGPRLRPAGSGVDVWPPRRAVEARCGTPRLFSSSRSRHASPDLRCTCGIYANRSLDAFERRRPAWPPPPVFGTVSLWGTVIEHERGWRGRFAYPARLRLVCAVCAWFEPGPGSPAAVHVFAKRLYPLCEIHRGGIQLPDGRRTRPTDVDPSVLQGRLIDAYAVDLLPQEAVASLFRKPAPEPTPAFIPAIRVVPLED